MSLDILLGLQWGDEGKGKIVDLLAPQYDIVARFQGGPNAGHTLYVNGKKQVLHTIPSGIIHPKVMNVIGGGMVIDPVTLKDEIETLKTDGLFDANALVISKNAHLILPTHQAIDQAEEESNNEQPIGSTQKGIGPCYADKAARKGLRIRDINDYDFEEKVRRLTNIHFEHLPENKQPNAERYEEWMASIQYLRELNLTDTANYLSNKLNDGKDVLAEGAQGTLLDLDHGSYPFVTSSNTLAANACLGLGLPPTHVRKVMGVFKAYMTRVGSGPFPTELHGSEGEALQHHGNEYGATTGRKRRCGWLDLPALHYATRINGVNSLIVTKADVLGEIEQPQYCEKLCSRNGQPLTYPDAMTATAFKTHLSPFQNAPGNTGDIPGNNANWRAFKEELEELAGIPIEILSTGPERQHYEAFFEE